MTLKTQAFPVGSYTYRVSEWEQIQHNWFIVESHLADDPENNYRFYTDGYLLNLLGLATERENRAKEMLVKAYLDSGNLAPYLVQAYKALAISEVTEEHVFIENEKGEVDEALTQEVREWLEQLNEGGFEGFLDEFMDGAAIFGTGYVAIRRTAEGYEGVCKDALSVYPVIDPITAEVLKVLVHYYETAAGSNKEELFVEEYIPGEVRVYRNNKLVPEASGPTGISSLTIVGAPFRTKRGSYFGRSALDGLIESLVVLCGVIGSANNAFRMQAGGLIGISSEDDVEAALRTIGGGPSAVDAVNRGIMRVLDPERPTVLAGKGMSISMVQGNVMASAQPLIQELKELFAMRCPIYAWHRLGANASGEAIRQTMMMLKIEMAQIKRNVRTLIVRLVKVLSELYGREVKGVVKFYPPDVFTPTQSEKLTEALLLFDRGLVPDKFILEVADVSEEETVKEFMEEKEAKAEAEKKKAEEEAAKPKETPEEAMAKKLFGQPLEGEGAPE